MIRGRLDVAKNAGSPEELVILANMTALRENRTVFISLFAVDDAGNQGDSSNVVSLSPAHDTAVPRVARENSASLKTFLAIVLPLSLATFVFLLIGVAMLVSRARRSKCEIIEHVDDNTLPSITATIDLGHMNYKFEGEYRKRSQEEPDTWSKGSI